MKRVFILRSKIMPIPFVPYQKEYQEQIKILATLLGGHLGPLKDAGLGTSSLFPGLTGTFHQREVKIGVVEETTRNGANPLSTDKYLSVIMHCASSLEMDIRPKDRFWKLIRLLWWKHVKTGNKTLDRARTITTPERHRSLRLLSHRKVQNLLIQFGPFHTLQMANHRLGLRYLITSHNVLIARNLAERLRQLDRLARIIENLA
jgi:hypothetical protein